MSVGDYSIDKSTVGKYMWRGRIKLVKGGVLTQFFTCKERAQDWVVFWTEQIGRELERSRAQAEVSGTPREGWGGGYHP